MKLQLLILLFITLLSPQIASSQSADSDKLSLNSGMVSILKGSVYNGILGDECQRIRFYFEDVEQREDKKFFVKGKTKTKDVICRFAGDIEIDSVVMVDEVYNIFGKKYAIDERSEVLIVTGIVYGRYNFVESGDERYIGSFSGDAKLLFRVEDGEMVKAINEIALLKINSEEFVGEWRSKKGDIVKNCGWSDYLMPNAPSDFYRFLGAAAEWVPTEKYHNNGWQTYWYWNRDLSQEEQQKMRETEKIKWWIE